jgi:hypothetical protein
VRAIVDVFEELRSDGSVHFQFVDRAQEKRLVQHGRQDPVGDPVPGHVGEQDAGRLLRRLELGGDLSQVLFARLFDARIHVVPLIEIKVNQVVAPDRPGERNQHAVDIDPRKFGDLARLRLELQANLLEVFQLLRQVTQLLEERLRCLLFVRHGAIRFVHK